MRSFCICSVLLLFCRTALNQKVEVFKSELFLERSALNSGLYDGDVKGRRLYDSTQVPHGTGTIYFFTNDRFNRHNYTGDWKEGQREGNGTTHFKDGAVYMGQYKQGEEDGVGTILYPNGNILEAEFKKGRIEGHGVFRYSSGDQREGFFSDNILDGQVIYTRNDGVTFIEKWANGTRLVDEDQLVQVGLNLADIITPKSSNNISDNDETAFNTDETAVNDDETAVDNDQTTGNKENIPNLKLRGEEQNGINLELIQKAIRSGDKRALFAAQDEIKNKEKSVEYAKIKNDSRRAQNMFLRSVFQSVNYRK